MTMGLGLLGSTHMMVKQKMRWFFAGLTSDGEFIFPASMVRLEARPDFPYKAVGDENGGHMEYIPSSIRIGVWSTEKGNYWLVRRNLTKLTERAGEVAIATLKLCDFTGEPLETWMMQGVKMVFEEINDMNEYMMAHWMVSYKKCDYHSPYWLVPSTSFHLKMKEVQLDIL
jgi:hypothetical protein